MKPPNQYFPIGNLIAGVTKSGDLFLFDKKKFEIVKCYNWYTHIVSGNKYVSTRINKKTVFLHRVILNFSSGDVDHKNNNGLDCREANLRACTHGNNMMNRRKKKKASSQYKGVYFYKPTQNWKAQIQLKGKKIAIGTYTKEIDAAVAYNRAAALYFGEYALLNAL